MYLWFKAIVVFVIECRRMSSFVRPSVCRRDSFANPPLQDAHDTIVSSTAYDPGVRTADLDVLLDKC